MRIALRRTGRSFIQSSDSTLHPEPYIERVWEDVKPIIQRALDRMDKRTTTDMIRADLLSQDRQLWVVRDSEGDIQAAIITMIEDYRGQKAGVLTHAAGEDFKSWESAVEPISRFFKTNGCETMKISGRRGWKKFLENRGFKEISTNYQLEIL